MKFDTNKLNVGKKQWIAIAVIAVVGVGLGGAILGGNTVRVMRQVQALADPQAIKAALE